MKDLIRMQQLAGIITEGQAKKMFEESDISHLQGFDTSDPWHMSGTTKQYRTPLEKKILNSPEDLTDEDLIVNGDLNLSFSPLQTLPSGLKGIKKLYLSKTNVTTLPDDLKVKQLIDLTYSKITTLPDNLKVGGSLYLNNSPIKQLPDNLSSSNLDIRQTNISEIPNNLKIRGTFYVFQSPLAKKYTNDQIKQMIEDKGGFVGRKVVGSELEYIRNQEKNQ